MKQRIEQQGYSEWNTKICISNIIWNKEREDTEGKVNQNWGASIFTIPLYVMMQNMFETNMQLY